MSKRFTFINHTCVLLYIFTCVTLDTQQKIETSCSLFIKRFVNYRMDTKDENSQWLIWTWENVSVTLSNVHVLSAVLTRYKIIEFSSDNSPFKAPQFIKIKEKWYLRFVIWNSCLTECHLFNSLCCLLKHYNGEFLVSCFSLIYSKYVPNRNVKKIWMGNFLKSAVEPFIRGTSKPKSYSVGSQYRWAWGV